MDKITMPTVEEIRAERIALAAGKEGYRWFRKTHRQNTLIDGYIERACARAAKLAIEEERKCIEQELRLLAHAREKLMELANLTAPAMLVPAGIDLIGQLRPSGVIRVKPKGED